MISLYEVLRRPIETEKSRYQNAKLHQYVFEVSPLANKPMVKQAVETLFDVEVVKVNIVTLPAKRGRRGRTRREIVRKPELKKAVVTIRADQSIDLFEGVK